LRCVARSDSIAPIMQRATTVWGTQGAVTGRRLNSQGVTLIDALTTGALQENGVFQHRAVLVAGPEIPGRRPGTPSGCQYV